MIVQWFAFAVLIVLLFSRAKYIMRNGNYLDKCTTSTINGFFICLVFLSHFSQYCMGSYTNWIGNFFKQLVVVMFLFYSGYGCAAQYCARGEEYLRVFPRRRMMPILVNFDIAVCVFIIVGLLLGKSFTLRQVALSFVCWDSVGNSVWYIFTILFCYGIFWASFKASYGNRSYLLQKREVLCIAFMVVFVFAVSRLKESYWYDTVMAFPAGVVFCIHKEKLEKFISRNYCLCFVVIAVLFFLASHQMSITGTRRWWLVFNLMAFNLKSVCFALLVVMGTMRISLRSPMLRWCGEHLFPLYIYQRIPMLIFSKLHPEAFRDWRCWLYCILSFAITLLISQQYRRFCWKG